MKKIKSNLALALAKGAINLFKLKEEKSYVLLLAHKAGKFIIPIINKKAYVDEDEEISETIESIVSEIIESKIFADLNGTKIFFKKAPEHDKNIKNIVITKGLCKYAKAEEVLTEAGYTVEVKKEVGVAVKKDYSKLLEDSFAKAIYDENKAELAKVGATFSTLNLETQIAYEGLSKGKYLGLIFAGPTGTGKSWAGRIIADHMGAPYLTLQIDRGTTVDTMVGSFVPKAGAKVSKKTANELLEIIRNPETTVEEALKQMEEMIKESGETAKWEFVPGPLLKAFQEGWPIILEEVNFGDPGVLAKLNEFTDGTLRVTINGVSYKRHPNFLVIMTMNPGYTGTDPLNVALKGRFAKVNVPALTKEQFCQRMIGYSKGFGHALSEEFFGKLYDFAARIELLGNDSMYHEDVKFSVRNAQRLCDIILTKARSLDEFSAAIAIQYINDLTMDNDNSEQVEKLKGDETIINDITAMYDLYDFAEVSQTEELADLSTFFSVEETEDSEEDLLDDSDLDDLMGGI